MTLVKAKLDSVTPDGIDNVIKLITETVTVLCQQEVRRICRSEHTRTRCERCDRGSVDRRLVRRWRNDCCRRQTGSRKNEGARCCTRYNRFRFNKDDRVNVDNS
jgi:hypothetical protein